MAVAPAAVRDPVRALLASLPGISARVVDSLDHIVWADTDALWLHDVHPTSPALRPWLDAGGRVLATLRGALLATDLGLESTPPDDVRDTVWEPVPGQDPTRGLAAFGPHPLFDGMQQGTCTWAPVAGESYRAAAYLAGRPSAGARGGGRARRHGVECGAHRGLGVRRRRRWAALHRERGESGGDRPAMRDAIAGARRQRAGRPRHSAPRSSRWGPALAEARGAGHPAETSHRFRRCRNRAATGPTPPPRSRWSFPSSRIVPWSLGGRRGFLTGGEGRGLREAWFHPFRVMRDVGLTVAGSHAGRLPDARHPRPGGPPRRGGWMSR